MNLFQTIWTWTIIFLLNVSIRRRPLLPAGCRPVNCHGYLTVEPAPLFLMGSNLTVYCHITQEECNMSSWFRPELSLYLNGPSLEPEKRLNCTTARFRLTNVLSQKTIVTCRLRTNGLLKTVCGLDLQSGLPPDKPTDINCEMPRSSDVIDCSWSRGRETYLLTTYNISVTRENGSQIHSDLIRDAGSFTLPRTALEENEKYQMIITACNQLGTSKSDPFILCVKDVMIPDTPHITQIQFWNNSMAVTLHWGIPEPSEHLRAFARLHTENGSWVTDKGAEIGKSSIQMGGLKPLTEYEFQIRACNLTSGLPPVKMSTSTSRPTSSERPLCSRWSLSVRRKSPGKGPSEQLHVWRMLVTQEANGRQNVTVLWKPPSPEDYSGEVHQYEIFLDNGQRPDVTCPAAVNQRVVQVSPRVQALSVRAVTSYGKSPPAAVPLRHSGVSGPLLRKLAPAGNGSVVVVSWSWRRSVSGGKLMNYMVEWTSGAAGLHWQRVAKNQTTTFIRGLSAGVRYKVSLYAVTTRGVSDPSSGLVYSQERKPKSGPKVSVLVHQDRRVQIQWEELAVDQQMGFITNYTIYLSRLHSSHREQITVPASGPRRMWLDCPEGAVALSLSASTSAGEGPQGNLVCSQPEDSEAVLVVGCVFIATLFTAIIANLMCWSCVRKRIKQKCVSLGAAWMAENLPKPGNSIAIRLLKEERNASEASCSFTYSDPPLSPIEEISEEERQDLYPIIHIQWFHAEPGQSTAEATLQTTDTRTTPHDRPLEHVSYKPQIAASALPGEEEEEVKEREEEQEDRCSVTSGGLLGGLLSSVGGNFSSPSLGLTLSSVSGLFRPKTPEISIFNSDCLLGETGTESELEVGTTSLDLYQGEKMTLDEADSCLSQYMVETTLTSGYFPQVAALNGAHN